MTESCPAWSSISCTLSSTGICPPAAASRAASFAVGAHFAENVLYTHGAIGDLYSSGTIFWMNVTVGVKVITGVGSIALLMLGVMKDAADEKEVK